jgi:hypothetical protein
MLNVIPNTGCTALRVYLALDHGPMVQGLSNSFIQICVCARVCIVLVMEPRALCMLGECSTTDPHPSPKLIFFKDYLSSVLVSVL